MREAGEQVSNIYLCRHYSSQWIGSRNRAWKTHRATPTIRQLESRSARGSVGSMMSSHNCDISAVKTERLGSFLNLDPKVAANLNYKYVNKRGQLSAHHKRPNPLSRLASSSALKNISYVSMKNLKLMLGITVSATSTSKPWDKSAQTQTLFSAGFYSKS